MQLPRRQPRYPSGQIPQHLNHRSSEPQPPNGLGLFRENSASGDPTTINNETNTAHSQTKGPGPLDYTNTIALESAKLKSSVIETLMDLSTVLDCGLDRATIEAMINLIEYHGLDGASVAELIRKLHQEFQGMILIENHESSLIPKHRSRNQILPTT